MPQISIVCNSGGTGAAYRDNGGGAGNESWATIRSGAGNVTVPDEIAVYNQYDDGLWQQLMRGIFQFNLNDPLLTGGTITAITFRLRVSGNNTTHTRGLILRIVSSTPASNTSLANSDYAQVSSTAQCDTDVALADIIPAADNDFVGNSAMVTLAQNAIGGYLSLGGRYTADINNVAPSQDAGYFSTVAFDKANTKVIITYTAATTTSTTTSTSTTVTTTSTSTTSTSTSTTQTTTSTSTTSTSTSTTSTSTTSTSSSTTSTSTTTTLAYVFSVEEAT